MLIVFEGADAVGKNEMSTRLTETIATTRGRSSTRISFPRYETSLGKAILRHLKSQISMMEMSDHEAAPEDALAFQCMMVAEKYHAAAEISGLLRSGVDVVCDRYWQSAYAFGGSDGLDEQWLLDVHEMMPKSDVNILLSLSPEEALARRPQMRDRYEKDREAQVKVRVNYLRLWSREALNTPPGEPSCWHIVDASRSRDEVFRDVMGIYDGALSKILKPRGNYTVGAGRYQEAPGVSLIESSTGYQTGRKFELFGRGASSALAYYDGEDKSKAAWSFNVSWLGEQIRAGRCFPIDGTPE